MKRIAWIFIYSIFVLPLAAQQKSKIYSLKECISTAITNNLEVNQAGLQVQSDEINWKQSRLDRLPFLDGRASQGINQGRSIDPFTNTYSNQQISFANYGINGGIVIFNGFTAKNTVSQHHLNYEASKMNWQQVKDNLAINVILAYLQAVANDELLAQAKSQAGLTKKQLERLEILNREGAIAPPLVYDLKGQYASDLLRMTDIENAAAASRISLARLMNIPADKNMELEKFDAVMPLVMDEKTSASIYQEALQGFAGIKAISLRRESAEKAVRIAKGRLFPTLSFNGGMNTNFSSAATQSFLLNTTEITTNDYVLVNGTPSAVIKKQNNYAAQKISYGSQLGNNIYNSFSLNLSIPIFHSFQARNRIKLSVIDLKNAELRELAAKTSLQQNIEEAYTNMVTAFNRYKILLQQVNDYTESYRAAEIRFTNGVGSSVDYLTAKNNLEKANSNLVSAKYDYLLRIRILDYYKGSVL
jgi:outer membrane protein